LLLPEGRTIHEIVALGRKVHPEYFGAFPVPQLTPWGYTLGHMVLTNGLYWIETNTFQKVLAVCFPMYDELSGSALNYPVRQIIVKKIRTLQAFMKPGYNKAYNANQG